MKSHHPRKELAPQLTHGELLQLKRWNTPTLYNGWKPITRHDSARDAFNLEEVRDFMPPMGVMIGYAVTAVCEPSTRKHKDNKTGWLDYYRHVAAQPGPKIVVVQDLDKPRTVGAFWGEVNANIHKALGCVGTIIDGAIRDLDEMTNAGFKALARRLCVGHAHSWPVRWDCGVEVFGRKVKPGQLIHADQHGFLVIPAEDRRACSKRRGSWTPTSATVSFRPRAPRLARRRAQRHILDLVTRRPRAHEWHVHLLVTHILGALLRVRNILTAASPGVPACVARVVNAVLAPPDRIAQLRQHDRATDQQRLPGAGR